MESKSKIHHCFNCGEETEDFDYLPNYKILYICHDKGCTREFTYACQVMESEAREKADDDEYSRYY